MLIILLMIINDIYNNFNIIILYTIIIIYFYFYLLTEISNLVLMRNSTLGQSAPSLSNSLVCSLLNL